MSTPSPIRRSSVAGRWYPGDPSRLASEVDTYLAQAVVEATPSPIRAIVAPHAGLMYSGPVAAYAYNAARRSRPKSIVLVGPSHFVSFDGVSIWPTGAWETPFGSVAVDEELARAIAEAWDAIVVLEAAHGREHSLEMQLPFLAHLMPGVPIVPMVMGHQTRKTAFALSHAIVDAVRATGEDILLVASSDLSHYEDAQIAAQLDGVVIERVAALDAGGLMQALEAEPRHACGGGPMVTVLDAAARLGASAASVLRYADSGDVSGDKSSVVGYMAAAIW
ncbi:MAG TPA: AmmeMemoRadiSam system protein B [Vicinamibacterales bacterium]|jgi:AmmeMemoRadiSam system protein B|nr:AmmeMemoRadiSam system protein B [Vicinamibacterales bacterium]